VKMRRVPGVVRERLLVAFVAAVFVSFVSD